MTVSTLTAEVVLEKNIVFLKEYDLTNCGLGVQTLPITGQADLERPIQTIIVTDEQENDLRQRRVI